VTGIELVSGSAAETEEMAARLGAMLKSGDVLALSGRLGAGKTVFARGLAKGLGTDPAVPVTSPTFVILHEHPGPVPLYHFDFYRLTAEDEVINLGYEEYFDGDGVTAVEWAEKFPALFGETALWVTMEWESETRRRIGIEPGQGFSQDRFQEISAELKS